MSDPESYGYSLEGETNPTDGDFSLEQTDNPLDTQIGNLVRSVDIGKSRVPGLYVDNGKRIEPYISVDGRTMVLRHTTRVHVIPQPGSNEESTLKNKTSMYVIPGPENMVRLADLMKTHADSMSGHNGEVPVDIVGRVGGALGFFATAGYFFNEIVLSEPNDGLRFLMFFLGAVVYLPGGAVGAAVGRGSGRLLAKAANSSKEAYARKMPVKIKHRTEKIVDGLISKNKGDPIPSTSNIVAGFNEAVMAMLIKDPNSTEFWGQYARPAIDKVASYDLAIRQLRQDTLNGWGVRDPNQEDEYILQFKGQSVAHALIRAYEERQGQSGGKER